MNNLANKLEFKEYFPIDMAKFIAIHSSEYAKEIFNHIIKNSYKHY